MLRAEMVAPCGLDCNICSQAQITDDPCYGCMGTLCLTTVEGGLPLV